MRNIIWVGNVVAITGIELVTPGRGLHQVEQTGQCVPRRSGGGYPGGEGPAGGPPLAGQVVGL